MNKIVSKRKIEGRMVYRIHHVMGDQLIGLEAVERTSNGRFMRIFNWNDNGDLEDYMNELDDIQTVSELEEKAVLSFLQDFHRQGKKELETSLKADDEALEVFQFLVAPFGYYAIIRNLDHLKVGEAAYYRTYAVILDRSGHFKRLDTLNGQADLELMLTNIAINMKDEERVFFQYHPVMTCGVIRKNDVISFTFIEEYTDEDGVINYRTGFEQTYQLALDTKSNTFTTPAAEWADEDKEVLIRDMLSMYTQVSADAVKQKK